MVRLFPGFVENHPKVAAYILRFEQASPTGVIGQEADWVLKQTEH